MRRRRRGFRPKWTYSNQQNLLVNSSTGTVLGAGPGRVDFTWLLPPARAQFLMNTKGRASLGFSGAHIWLSFYWYQQGSTANLSDVNFGIFKTVIESVGDLPDLSPMAGQWTEPSTPASITSWEEDDDDGTNPFLWQHFIKGQSPPNAVVSTFDYDGSSGADHAAGNQSNRQHGASTDTPLEMCRKFHVTQEWQPDVVVRAKRRVMKGEGILLAMFVPQPAATLSAVCDVRFRTLTK